MVSKTIQDDDGIFIGVTGHSGVGKTTIAKMLSLILGYKETLLLSGDDLHKWERNSPYWEKYTHLNPRANNITQGIEDIKMLKDGKAISRKLYNHKTGSFTEIKTITPRKHLIYSGLHALYGPMSKNIFDLSIYIESGSELQKEWKVNRDTLERGYDKTKTIDIIKQRAPDEKKYIIPQKKRADTVVNLTRKNNQIKLDYTCDNEKYKYILDHLVELYDEMFEFLNVLN